MKPYLPVTRIPHLYAIATGSIHTYVAQIHAKYPGNVVRLSPDELSFIDPQAWHDIYSYRAKGSQGSPPPKHFLKYMGPTNGHPSLLEMPDNSEHARSRRVFNPAFSDRALTQQEPVFMRYVDQLIRILRQGIEMSGTGAATFDMVKMYSKYFYSRYILIKLLM